MPKKKKKAGKSAFDGYGYSTVDGEACYGKFVYDEDDKASHLVKYGRYIAVERVSIDLDGGPPIFTIAYDTLDGDRRTINVEKTMMAKKKDLQEILLKADADAYESSLTVLMHCLHNSEETAERGLCFHRTGWQNEQINTPDELLSFKGGTLISSDPVSATASYVGQYDLAPKGSFDTWVQMVKTQVLGQTGLEVAILIGLSSIISSEWGSRNLVFHFMGDSSTGKTTSAILAVSVHGCPNPAETAKYLGSNGGPLRSLMSSWKSTANALTGKLDGLDGTLMVLDELSKADSNDSLASAIYVFSDGDDKDRMNANGGLQRTNVIRTNVLSVGEESLLEKAKNKNSGINIRVCEICTEFTDTPARSETIVEVCYENYGHAASKFAEYIVNNMTYKDVADLRKENLDEYEAALVAGGFKSKTPRRLSEFGAILLTVADIAGPALGIKFNRSDIIDFLVEQQVQNDANSDIGLRAHAALHSFISTNNANFITNSSKVWTKSIPCYGRLEMKNGVMEATIDKNQFPNIMRQLGFNNSDLIIQKLKQHGLLVYEAKKNYRKRTIVSAVGEIRVFVIRFP